MVDSVKQYNLAGVAANVELGKQGPVIDGSSAGSVATGYSVYFDGTDALTLDSSSWPDLDIGYNEFVLEGWVRYDQWDDTTQLIVGNGYGRAAPDNDLADNIQLRLTRDDISNPNASTDPVLMGVIYENPNGYSVKSDKLSPGVFYHFAFVKWHGGSGVPYTGTKELRMYINGTLQGTTDVSTSLGGSANGPQVSQAGYNLTVGGRKNSNGTVTTPFKGYVSNLHLVIGSPLYTANFIAPTSPLTFTTGSEFLIAKDSTFVDNGPKNFSITDGGAEITNVSPFTVSTSGISFKTSAGSLIPIAIAEGTDPTHAVALSQLGTADSGKLAYITTQVSYDSGTVAIGNAAANAYIHSVTVEKTAGNWVGADSSTEITVGDSSNNSRLFEGFDPAVQNTSEVDHKYTSATTINAYVTQGGASSGSAKVTIWYSGTID